MNKLEIKISNISFVQEQERLAVRLHFRCTSGENNIEGHVVANQMEFFQNSGSPEAMTELVRGKLIEMVEKDSAA